MQVKGGGVFSIYSQKDGSFNFYPEKYTTYGITLVKNLYYDLTQRIDTTQTVQNFSIKMQKRN